jgi:hypothetical protein
MRAFYNDIKPALGEDVEIGFSDTGGYLRGRAHVALLTHTIYIFLPLPPTDRFVPAAGARQIDRGGHGQTLQDWHYGHVQL